jgi:hypothetical protein
MPRGANLLYDSDRLILCTASTTWELRTGTLSPGMCCKRSGLLVFQDHHFGFSNVNHTYPAAERRVA